MTHPYYPVDLMLPGYAPPAIPFQQVLAWFFGVCGTFFALTWFLTGARDQRWRINVTICQMTCQQQTSMLQPSLGVLID